MLGRFASYFFRATLLLFCLLCSAFPGHAQNAISTGTLVGTVTDPSGAVVANASIALTASATGTKWTTSSNGQGIYTFPALPVGEYQVIISAAGFRATELSGVTISVGHTSGGNAALSIGSAGDVVKVDAQSDTSLDASDTSIGTLVSQHVVANLPLSGRRYTDFVLLTPNVTTDGQFGHITFAGQSGGDLSGYNNTSGGASNANGSSSFTVDGSDATSYYYGDNRGFTRIPYIFGLQAIQEFQVQPNVYSAAYGGAGAGFINTVTKSGTNQWHGDAFYYNRNSATGANDAVDKANGNAKPLNVLQQFGADIGGPLVHDKAFFYFDYEQQRHKNPLYAVNPGQAATDVTDFGLPTGTVLPTPNSHYPVATGLSEADIAADPTSPAYLQGVSNALNVIHSNLGPRQRRRDDYEFFPKFDWQLSEKDHLTVLYNYNHFQSPGGIITFSPESFAGTELLGNNGVRDHVAMVHWTHTLSNSLVNDMHVSYVRDEQMYSPSGLAPSDTTPEIILTQSHGGGSSTLLLGNATFAYNNLREYQWQFADHLTWILGKHQLEMGYDLNHDSISTRNPANFYGTYIFTSLEDFALGKWNIFQQTAGDPTYNFSDPFMGFYINDTWKAARNLTVTAGVREDFQIYPNPAGNPALPFTQKFNNQYQRVSPRLGFSYAPTTKTVIRGGAGLYYEIFVGGNYQNSTQANGVSQTAASLTDFSSTSTGTSLPVVFAGALPSSSSSFSSGTNIATIAPNYKTPSVVNASLQIDQEIAPHTVLTLGSMWSHGMHLTSSTAYDMNQERPTGTITYVTPTGSVTEPNLNNLSEGAISSSFGQINALISPGINNYVSFFTQVNRQMAKGASLVLSYTLSKSTQSGVDFYNQFDLSNTHGLSLLDQRHRLSVATVYAPTYNSDSEAARALLNHWTISMISQFNSGRPYTALVSDLNDSAAQQSTNNTAAGLGGGNSPGYGLAPGEDMNSYTGPWITEIDLGLQRDFMIGARNKITLKAQAFNLFNSANYYVQAGSGINQVKYTSSGDCSTDGGTCTLTPNNSIGGFQTRSSIAQPNPPRVLQFSFGYSF
ncbi:MAG: carboxypeptidase regulatory-like domain-containing protein [Acidobacteriaceae bacterium]|nr:carboxypeptidase regulatory-like domain-containing protein [Acidobacteriaceae bacterium]